MEKGISRGFLRLEGLEKKIEVGGREHVVKVIDGGAELEKSESGKKLLRIRIMAEMDGVRREYEITYGRYGKDNAAVGYAYASAEAPGAGRQTPKGSQHRSKPLRGGSRGCVRRAMAL